MNTIQKIQQLLGVNPDGQFESISYRVLQNAIDNNSPIIIQIQGLLGVKQDGQWGTLSRGALQAAMQPPVPAGFLRCITSEFATDSDLAAYNKAIAEGKTPIEAFAVGDNCVGCWGTNTNGPTPMVALPPETIESTFGAPWRVTGKNNEIIVTNPVNGESIVAVVADVMPHLAHIRNGCGCDSNPAVCQGIGLPYGAMVEIWWKPVSSELTPAANSILVSS